MEVVMNTIKIATVKLKASENVNMTAMATDLAFLQENGGTF